jgi:Predicted hydrolases or acyltransferases (alpha/beta hydrolase superfamily)
MKAVALSTFLKPFLMAAIFLIVVSTINAQPKVTEGYFPGADGVKLFYRKLGSGPQTVVFLHGGPGLGMGDGGSEMAALARNRVVLMYDQRGSGRSQVVSDPSLLSVDHQVRDLESFRQHFGLERMTLIGLSWGAGLATLYTAAHPDRVERLLLISPMPPAKTPYWEQRTKSINALIGPANVARLTAIRTQLSGSSDKEAVTLCREYFRISSPPYLLNPKAFTTERSERMCDAPAAALRNRFIVVLAVFESLGDWDFRRLLAKISVPALVMEGEETSVPLEATREWVAHLPNGKLVLIPKAGHVFFMEKPQAFVRAADQFLRGR